MVDARDNTIGHIRRTAGEAGHVTYHVDLSGSDGSTRQLAFAGNIFTGPVVMTSKDEVGHWDHRVIDDPRQFGEFVSTEWVRRFLIEDDAAGTCAVCAERRYG